MVPVIDTVVEDAAVSLQVHPMDANNKLGDSDV